MESSEKKGTAAIQLQNTFSTSVAREPHSLSDGVSSVILFSPFMFSLGWTGKNLFGKISARLVVQTHKGFADDEINLAA